MPRKQIDNDTKADIRAFCMNCDDPQGIENGMMEAIKEKIRYSTKWNTLEKLRKLLKLKIGTTQIESLAMKIEGQGSRKESTVILSSEDR
jgi:hypothetical protein